MIPSVAAGIAARFAGSFAARFAGSFAARFGDCSFIGLPRFEGTFFGSECKAEAFCEISHRDAEDTEKEGRIRKLKKQEMKKMGFYLGKNIVLNHYEH